MRAFYNEIDRYCCDWLSNLMDAGRITPGKIDDRPIQQLSPADIAGYQRAHFFAGVGGWDHALNLAGWGDRPVWTGSCPCQPFSAAGQQRGADDERHLWPHWFRLITQCRPPTVFGEQVDAAVRQGWLDAVFTDLEDEGYACGAAVLPACGVGAPHIRQRLWFVAHADDQHGRGQHEQRGGHATWPRQQLARGCRQVELGHTDSARPQGRRVGGNGADQRAAGSAGVAGGWAAVEWLPCTDGKARPVEPGTFPLAHGVPGRVGRLRAYGNAIVPQAAAEFITAVFPDMRAT